MLKVPLWCTFIATLGFGKPLSPILCGIVCPIGSQRVAQWPQNASQNPPKNETRRAGYPEGAQGTPLALKVLQITPKHTTKVMILVI